jgi:hypothetical protein
LGRKELSGILLKIAEETVAMDAHFKKAMELCR